MISVPSLVCDNQCWHVIAKPSNIVLSAMRKRSRESDLVNRRSIEWAHCVLRWGGNAARNLYVTSGFIFLVMGDLNKYIYIYIYIYNSRVIINDIERLVLNKGEEVSNFHQCFFLCNSCSGQALSNSNMVKENWDIRSIAFSVHARLQLQSWEVGW